MLDVGAEQRAHARPRPPAPPPAWPAARLQQPRGIGQREGAGGAQRRVFAQRMAGDETRMAWRDRGRASLLQHADDGDARRHDRGLGIFGEDQIAFGAFPHQARKLLLQRLVDFLEHFAGAARNASASALPMPTAWLPCPGKDECARHFNLENRARDKTSGGALVKAAHSGRGPAHGP